MAKIKEIKGFEILDSKGDPTIETTVLLDNGTKETASCPSGTSVGTYEAVELRDGDIRRFQGKGVLKAIENIERIISPKLIGQDADNQQQIDRTLIELDATPNKQKLGANATLSVSIAICKAAAKSNNEEVYTYLRRYTQKENKTFRIPTPLFNVLNGGLHAGGNSNFQEYLVIPATSKTYTESLNIGTSIYKQLKEVLKQNGLITLVGFEGGYAPALSTNNQGLFFIKQAIEGTSFRLGYDVFLGLDVASNSFYQDKKYKMKEKPAGLSYQELIAYYQDLYTNYRLLYLEDPLFENDLEGWTEITQKMSPGTIIVGDDLIATNPYRLQMAIDKKGVTGVIIKPNQIGTVLETIAVVEMAKSVGLKTIVSHRSGETNDSFIADFAVGVDSDYVKFGAPARGERIAKYNRLLYIEQEIKSL